MENIITNVCAKINYDRLRIDKVLGKWKSDNNKNKTKKQDNDRSAQGLIPGTKIKVAQILWPTVYTEVVR